MRMHPTAEYTATELMEVFRSAVPPSIACWSAAAGWSSTAPAVGVRLAAEAARRNQAEKRSAVIPAQNPPQKILLSQGNRAMRSQQ